MNGPRRYMPLNGLAAGIAVLCLAPAIANASLVLDTGTPTTGANLEELTTSQWFAAEFSLSAGETVTSLSAYLAGNTGATYTLDIFSGANFTGVRLSSQTLDYSTGGTFTTNNAWNTTSANWTAPTSGNYWLAIEVTGTQPRGTNVNVLTTANNGTAPAEGFAYLGSSTNGEFTTSGAPDVAFQVNAAPVPLPPAALLFGGGLLGLLGFRRSGIAIRQRRQERE